MTPHETHQGETPAGAPLSAKQLQARALARSKRIALRRRTRRIRQRCTPMRARA